MPHKPLQVRLLKPKLFTLISTGFTDEDQALLGFGSKPKKEAGTAMVCHCWNQVRTGPLFSHSPPSTVSAPDISIREMHNIFQLLQRIVMTV